jgi:hypothetical protein
MLSAYVVKLSKAHEPLTTRTTRNLGGARRFQVVCEALKGVVEGCQDIKGGWKVCSTSQHVHLFAYSFGLCWLLCNFKCVFVYFRPTYVWRAWLSCSPFSYLHRRVHIQFVHTSVRITHTNFEQGMHVCLSVYRFVGHLT